MTKTTLTAGAKLRAELDAALARAAEEVGHALEFDEAERHVIDQAAEAADRAEEIRALYRAELAREPEPRPRSVVALAAEARLTEKAAVDFVARVKLGLGAAKSPHRVRAGPHPLAGPAAAHQGGVVMARAATVPLVRNATLYAWLADRERRAVAAGGTLPQGDGTPCWDGSRERLAALQRGEAVDLPLYGLPAWTRVGEPLHWWRRAVVDADGIVTFRDDDGAAWLAENGL